MNILHTTVTVVADSIEAKVTVHFLAPQRRDIFYLNLAFDQSFFDFIAQDHVRRVADFVSVYADQAWFHSLI
ncbi:hypothetical protein D3C81_1316900 [compost metagenome]